MARFGFPVLDQIHEAVERFGKLRPDIARVESLGVSQEGRDIKAVCITDNTVAAEQKETAIVICGRHGNELGTRVVGTALLEWLASPQGEETRRRQFVIVVPVANPDGCVREEFFAPRNRLSDVEQRTLGELAWTHKPDTVIDVHSLGGSDIEAIITANTTHSGEDAFIHRRLAANAANAAGREGYPFLVHEVRRAGDYNNFLCGMCYETFHCLAFGMEVNHASLTPEHAGRSAVAAIRSLLSAGNRRWPWERHTGYPNRILLGDFFTSVRAAGSNAEERRESRSMLWQNRRRFTRPKREISDDAAVRVSTAYAGKPLQCALSLCCRIRGNPVLKTVRLNGTDMDAHTHTDNCSTYVCVDIRPSGKEEYQLSLEF